MTTRQPQDGGGCLHHWKSYECVERTANHIKDFGLVVLCFHCAARMRSNGRHVIHTTYRPLTWSAS